MFWCGRRAPMTWRPSGAPCSASRLPVLVVGMGSNLLVADAGFRGVAVVLDDSEQAFGAVAVDGTTVRAGGAVALPVLARRTVRAGLAGLEWAVGVPGSVGGALTMNAGGHGSDVAATLVRAWVADLSDLGKVTARSRSDLALGYRTSAVADDQVVVEAEFALRHGDVEAGNETIRRDRAVAARAPTRRAERRLGLHQPAGRSSRALRRRARRGGGLARWADRHRRGISQARQLHPGRSGWVGRRRAGADAAGASGGRGALRHLLAAREPPRRVWRTASAIPGAGPMRTGSKPWFWTKREGVMTADTRERRRSPWRIGAADPGHEPGGEAGPARGEKHAGRRPVLPPPPVERPPTQPSEGDQGSGRHPSAAPVHPRMKERWVAARREEGRRRLRVLLAVVGIAVLLGAGAAVVESPLVGVRRVHVGGNVHETAAQVRSVAGLTQGKPLVSVSPSRAAARLETLPWVAKATVRRQLAHDGCRPHRRAHARRAGTGHRSGFHGAGRCQRAGPGRGPRRSAHAAGHHGDRDRRRPRDVAGGEPGRPAAGPGGRPGPRSAADTEWRAGGDRRGADPGRRTAPRAGERRADHLGRPGSELEGDGRRYGRRCHTPDDQGLVGGEDVNGRLRSRRQHPAASQGVGPADPGRPGKSFRR